MSLPDLSVFRNKRILVIGDAMLDIFLQTTATRRSPEFPDAPVYDVIDRKTYPGGAANVAMNLKGLGALPYLVSVTGNDPEGETLRSLLSAAGISTEYLFADSTRITTVKTRVINSGTPAFRIDEEHSANLSGLATQFLLKNIRQAILDHKPHAILIQDYDKGVLNADTIPAILDLARSQHLPVAVDPKFRNWTLYQDVDLFKPNQKEFVAIGEQLNTDTDDLETIAKVLQEKIGFSSLLVTLGAQGNFWFDANGSNIDRQPSSLPEADVCGAGDSVIAAATLGLVCGFSPKQIAELANRAGYAACKKGHVQPVTLDELSGH